MKTENEIVDFIQHGYREYISGLTLDCVIFGYHDRELKVLLGKYKWLNGWGMPGGYIRKTELLSNAAERILKEKTSLENVYLEQFHIFGDTSYRKQKHKLAKPLSNTWLAERTLSIGYFALVDFSKVEPVPDFIISEYKWYDIKELPELLFDHSEMIAKALEHLRIHLYHKPIGYNLLRKKFTLPDIQSLYETILDKKLDRRNFPKKLMSLGLINDTNEVKKIGQHRSPKLYSFDKKNYNAALKKGIVLVF